MSQVFKYLSHGRHVSFKSQQARRGQGVPTVSTDYRQGTWRNQAWNFLVLRDSPSPGLFSDTESDKVKSRDLKISSWYILDNWYLLWTLKNDKHTFLLLFVIMYVTYQELDLSNFVLFSFIILGFILISAQPCKRGITIPTRGLEGGGLKTQGSLSQVGQEVQTGFKRPPSDHKPISITVVGLIPNRLSQKQDCAFWLLRRKWPVARVSHLSFATPLELRDSSFQSLMGTRPNNQDFEPSAPFMISNKKGKILELGSCWP